MNNNGPEPAGASRSHILNIVPARLAERVWYTKSQSSLLDIYFRFSGIQSLLLLIYFREGPNRCLSWCKYVPKYGTKPIRCIWGSTFKIVAAQLRSVTKIAPPKPFLCVNSRTIRYDFLGGAKAIRHSVNKALTFYSHQQPQGSFAVSP